MELRLSGGSGSSNTFSAPTTNLRGPSGSDIQEALVTIDAVSIVPAEDTSRSDSTEVGVTALSDSNFTVDLVDLQAGLDTALTEIDIPAGTYGQIRLVTAGPAEVTFQGDSTARDVMIASGQQTGLKVNFEPFTVNGPDDRVSVTLNWDVEESLKGNPAGQFVITPVIQATVDSSGAGN